jgi:hypothetical protein
LDEFDHDFLFALPLTSSPLDAIRRYNPFVQHAHEPNKIITVTACLLVKCSRISHATRAKVLCSDSRAASRLLTAVAAGATRRVRKGRNFATEQHRGARRRGGREQLRQGRTYSGLSCATTHALAAVAAAS